MTIGHYSFALRGLIEKGLLGTEKTGGITMKKLFFINALKTSVLSLTLLMSACMIGFTSCSDDDEDDSTSGGIVGTWQSVYVTTWEKMDGELTEDGSHSGVPEIISTMIFNADGTFSITDEEGKEEGTYKLTGDKLALKPEGESDSDESKVLELNENKLVLEYHEHDGTYESYAKVEFKRVK